MQAIQFLSLMVLTGLRRLATVAALLALPLVAHAAPVTFNVGAVLFGEDGAPPAGQLTGSIDYDVKSGLFSAARMQVVLNGTGDLFELITIDPDFNALGRIVVIGDVKGESSDKDHKGEVSLLFTQPPGPSKPIDFSGSFLDRFPGVDPVTYSLRGTAALAVPEPGTLALVGLSVIGLGMTRRRR